MAKVVEGNDQFPTQHPLLVSVEAGDFEGCGNATEGCKLWGAGQLNFIADRSTFSGTVAIVAAGCEACAKPEIRNDQVGKHLQSYAGEVHTTRTEAVKELLPRAYVVLSNAVQALRPTQASDSDPLSFEGPK